MAVVLRLIFFKDPTTNGLKKTTPLPRKLQPHRQPQLKLHSCMQVNWISTLSEIKLKKTALKSLQFSD